MRTVYVMGAGASKHVGYPLISGMSKQLFEWMAVYPNDMFRNSADFLVERFGTDPNIEDVITEIDSLIDSNMKDRLQHFKLVTARQRLFDSLREWFRELHLRPAFAYAKFANEVIQTGDVVITFNYDDSLERELRRAGKWDVSLGYGFPLSTTPQPSSVTVLASILGGATSGMGQVDIDEGSIGQHPVIPKADLEFLGYPNFSGYVYPGGGAFPSLILPGRNKQFFYRTSFGNEWKLFFDSLWCQAGAALTQADKIVICGYGMAPSPTAVKMSSSSAVRRQRLGM